MTAPAKAFLRRESAARYLDMRPDEFAALVTQGVLPQPVDIGPHQRWRREDLEAIGSAKARTPDDVDWSR